MNLKEITKIFIIESPSAEDIKDDRKEGHALSEILRLANIQNSYRQVANSNELEAALGSIATEVNSHKNKFGAITLHFSFHANEDGFRLTSQEIVKWSVFFGSIKKFEDRLGYIAAPGIKIAPVNLNFSACKGYNAVKIKPMGETCPYFMLVGPTENVDWSDSLLAFATYYHNTIHKRKGNKEAVALMNIVNGFQDIFQFDLAPGFLQK